MTEQKTLIRPIAAAIQTGRNPNAAPNATGAKPPKAMISRLSQDLRQPRKQRNAFNGCPRCAVLAMTPNTAVTNPIHFCVGVFAKSNAPVASCVSTNITAKGVCDSSMRGLSASACRTFSGTGLLEMYCVEGFVYEEFITPGRSLAAPKGVSLFKSSAFTMRIAMASFGHDCTHAGASPTARR